LRPNVLLFVEELETTGKEISSVEEELSGEEESFESAAIMIAEASLEALSQAVKEKASPQTARQAILSTKFFFANIIMEGLLITSNLY
jgi:hypothetical protein